jgi:glutamate synthase (NADPH/NADH) large chain
VILGEIGANFGAGMTGDVRLRSDWRPRSAPTPENITWARLRSLHWADTLLDLVRDHADATDSKWSKGLLVTGDRVAGHFWQIVPKEMLTRLPHPLDDSASWSRRSS